MQKVLRLNWITWVLFYMGCHWEVLLWKKIFERFEHPWDSLILRNPFICRVYASKSKAQFDSLDGTKDHLLIQEQSFGIAPDIACVRCAIHAELWKRAYFLGLLLFYKYMEQNHAFGFSCPCYHPECHLCHSEEKMLTLRRINEKWKNKNHVIAVMSQKEFLVSRVFFFFFPSQ